MNRNGHREEKSCCYFHPRQVVVGVCPLCLNERLLIVAAKQGHHPQNRSNSASKASSHSHRLQSSIHRKPPTSIHKIFAFGSLFSRPQSQQWKSEINYEYDVSSSPEGKYLILLNYSLLMSSSLLLLCFCVSLPLTLYTKRKRKKEKFFLSFLIFIFILFF